MSCFHPITIPNPKLVKNNVYDKKVIEVPCGHCAACKDSKRLSWFVRLYYEWQYCIDQHGFALYETLTYNNEHLPHIYDFYNGKDIEKHIPCFSVRDIQLYLKKIRKRLTYFGYDIQFKYFLSMEYGGKTHRPHYHVCFFVPSAKISPWFFKRIVEDKWIENGFVKSGSMNNGFICSQGGLSYCAKYVCKDIYEDAYFRRIKTSLEKLHMSDCIAPCFPHVMCSKNLGLYALELDNNNDLDNFLKGDIFLPDEKLQIKQYKLPLYYERKLFFDVKYRYFDSHCNDYLLVSKLSDVPLGFECCPVYVLNDLGIEMKSARAQKALDSVSNVYRICMSIPEFPTFLKKLNDKFNTSFDSIKSFQTFINSQLPEEVFVSYSLVYRGCSVSYNTDCGCESQSNSYYDYMLVHNMSRGVRPLSVDFQKFCNNVQSYSSIPYIEDNYKMIRYLYYLIHLELEQFKDELENDYVNQKTAYLMQQYV